MLQDQIRGRSRVVPGWFQRTRTHHDACGRAFRDVGRFREGMRSIAAGCVGVGRDYESVALPLSYPGVSRTDAALVGDSSILCRRCATKAGSGRLFRSPRGRAHDHSAGASRASAIRRSTPSPRRPPRPAPGKPRPRPGSEEGRPATRAARAPGKAGGCCAGHLLWVRNAEQTDERGEGAARFSPVDRVDRESASAPGPAGSRSPRRAPVGTWRRPRRPRPCSWPR